jgi:Kef-type K+ transport system membrane component KefB
VQGDETVLVLLSEFGFVFLMFLSGIEIDFSNLSLSGSKEDNTDKPGSITGPVQIGTLTFLATIILAVIFGFIAMWIGIANNPWMLALILSTTSLGVVLPVLKERGLSTGRYGQTLLVSALIADFVTMLLITILVAALSHGITLDVLLISVLFVAFVFLYRVGYLFFNRFTFLRNAMDDVSHATGQIKMRLALTIMMAFVVLAEILGAEVILGAFLAGAIVALLRTPEDADVVAQLEAIGFGFFIPIFFIMVGVSFNLQALLSSPENLLLAVVLILVAFFVKFLPALFSDLHLNGANPLPPARCSQPAFH